MDNYLPAEIPAHLLAAVADLPAELQAQALAMYKPDASRFRSIATPRFGQFELREGGAKTAWPPGQPLYVVILGKSEKYHRQWYGGKVFQPGMSEAPVAQWYEGDPVPAIVPPECFSEQAPANMRVIWKRRLVVAIMYHDAAEGSFRIDWEKPYVWDLGGKSCFKPGYPQQNMYSFSSFEALCGQQNALVCDMAISMQFDPNESVPVVVLTPATYPGTNTISKLPADVRIQIIKKGLTAEVRDLLNVKRIDGTEKTETPAAPQQPAYTAPPTQPAYVPPTAPQQPMNDPQAQAIAAQQAAIAQAQAAQEQAQYAADLAAQQAALAQTQAMMAQMQGAQTAPPAAPPVTAPVPQPAAGMNDALLAAAAQAQAAAAATLAATPPPAAPPVTTPVPTTAAALTDDLASVLNDINAL